MPHRPDHELRPSTSHPEVHLPKAKLPADLLAGQVAVITGSSSGIGAAMAEHFAWAGADVVVNYRSKEEGAEAAAEKVRAAGRRAIVVQADVSEEEDVNRLFEETRREFGTFDIMVANAGIENENMIEDVEYEEFQKVLHVNLGGAFLCAKHAVREFRRRGARPDVSAAAGKIIFNSSVHDIIPWKGFTSYTASKGGLLMFMQSLALEVARERIRVNCVSPGAIRTPINQDAWEGPEKYCDLIGKIPYNRVGEPQDVAHVAALLASDLMDYVTGTTVYVDGGMTLYPSFEHGG